MSISSFICYNFETAEHRNYCIVCRKAKVADHIAGLDHFTIIIYYHCMRCTCCDILCWIWKLAAHSRLADWVIFTYHNSRASIFSTVDPLLYTYTHSHSLCEINSLSLRSSQLISRFAHRLQIIANWTKIHIHVYKVNEEKRNCVYTREH